MKENSQVVLDRIMAEIDLWNMAYGHPPPEVEISEEEWPEVQAQCSSLDIYISGLRIFGVPIVVRG